MQTPETTAAAGQPANLISEPAHYCTSNVQPGTLCVDLKGWPEGVMTWGDWLDAGGPIDATERLPSGGAWSHQLTFGHLTGGSVQRAGALA